MPPRPASDGTVDGMPLLDAVASDELPPARPQSVELAGRRVLVVRLDDAVHAIDDACPQDGAQLLGGELAGTAIRCERHGGRYDLVTGQSLRGGEDVRRYHAREEHGRVLVQVDELLPELDQARLVASLRAALLANDHGWMARDAVRLLSAGGEPTDLVKVAVRYGAERGQGGFHSALAACADFARIAPLYDGPAQGIPLGQALVAVAQANRGRSQRPIPAQARGVLVGSSEARRRAFVLAVEERRADDAEAMLSGALWQGLALSEAQQWLLAASCAHVIDGGATLVHAAKALDLCDLLGTREALHVLPPLVPPLVFGIREERTGPLRQAAELLDSHRGGFEHLAMRADPAIERTFQDRAIRTTLLEGSASGAFDAVLSALGAGVPPKRIGLSIALAAAERALRFDEHLEWDDRREQTWREVLQPFVYAVAAMRAVERWTAPETVRALVLAAASVQAARDLETEERHRQTPRLLPIPPREDEAIVEIIASVRMLRAAEAVALTRGFVERGHSPWRLFDALARFVVEDNLPSQTHVEQAAALVLAAVDAWEAATEHADGELPLLLAVRYLATDARQRWIRRDVLQAIDRLRV